MVHSSKTVSVKQKLLNATHSGNIDRPYWELAQFLLLHYNDIDHLNGRILANTCHVSFSTVRRFCQSLGYDNFADLQRAKLENPENQYQIALDNYHEGRYVPRRLYDEISKSLWAIGQKIDWDSLNRLAIAIAASAGVVAFALRPYFFMLQEVQSQFFSLNKPFYIFDDILTRRDLFDRLKGNFCFMTVSLGGILFPAIDSDFVALEGFKAAVYCPVALTREKADGCLKHYDLRFPLLLRTNDYNYLEIYGKYAVSYFFDLLLGAFIECLC